MGLLWVWLLFCFDGFYISGIFTWNISGFSCIVDVIDDYGYMNGSACNIRDWIDTMGLGIGTW